MVISIVGAGNVGRALGKAWIKAGHKVYFGVRDPEKERGNLKDEFEPDQLKTIKGASKAAEVIVLCVPWPAVESAIQSCGDLKDKIIIDCTNPLTSDFWNLSVGFNFSGAEHIASLAKGAKVYKSFNQTGFENMSNPDGYSIKPVMYVCGDDEDGKLTVLSLVSDVGFEPVDFGALEAARILEPFAMVWIRQSIMTKERNFAFALIRPD